MEELLKRLLERANKRIAYSSNSGGWLARAIRRIQAAVFAYFVAEYLDSFFQDSAKMKLTVQSAYSVNRVAAMVEAEYKNQAAGLLQRIAGRLLRLFDYSKDYFGLLGLPETEAQTALRVVMASYGFDTRTGIVIPGGYLDSVINSPAVAQLVGQQIREGMAAGMSKREFMKKFRGAFVNPGGTGYLDRHFNRFSQDLFQQFDRVSNITLANAAGLTHFMYAGTAVDDSRLFCLERLNRVYTEAEGRKWDGQEWRGKIPNVPALQQLGGYNCRHTLMYLSEELAKTMEAEYGPINEYNEIKETVK